MKNYAYFALLLATTATISAEAATLTQTQAFDAARANPRAVFDFGFDPFDSALGTLDAVSLSFSATNNVQLQFVCDVRPVCTGTEIRSQYAFFAGSGAPDFLDAAGQRIDLVAGDTFPLFGRPVPFDPQRIIATRPGISVVSEQFELPLDGRFATATDDPIGISLIQSVSVGSNEGTLPIAVFTNRVVGSVSLSYDFTPAPEVTPVPLPAGLWLMLSGLGLLLTPRLKTLISPRFGGPTI